MISERLLKSLLKEFTPAKSSGCLQLSSRLYLDAFDVLTEQLLFLMNLSLKTHVFPTAWKRSVVIPIPKKGDRHLMENTRPISLIHICGKLLEKIVNSLITTYIINNQIITNQQYGFMKNKSTIGCITSLCQDLFHNINSNNLTCCLFLDYSKAFDSVNHEILLEKLRRYGFSDTSWFESYLSDRTQLVRVGNAVSLPKRINCGVPQGSVLGPTLFNFYVNDLATLPLYSKLLIYADDVVLYISGDSLNDILDIMQSDINKIHLWSIKNKLCVSPAKTKTMILARPRRLSNLPVLRKLKIGDKPLEWVRSFTYLGVTIDDQLSFNAAIDQMHRKAAHKLKTLYHIRQCLTSHSGLLMAKSMILPYLEYGLIFLNSCPDAQLRKLQILQNKILKCALGKNSLFSTRLLHKQTGTLLIKDQIRYQQLSLIQHDFMNNSPLFPRSNSGITRTRSSDAVTLPVVRPTCELFRRSIYYQGILDWNNLSSELKNSSSLHSFKIKLKRQILDSYDPPT